MDYPFNALSVAIGAGATFAARSVDVFLPHLKATLKAAAAHKGTAFVEIYQNCNIFNDKAFANITEKETREDSVVELSHGKPLVFGKTKEKGIRLNGTELEVITFADGFSASDCLVWDETRSNPAIAFMVAQMSPPNFPTPIGVLRRVDLPNFESGMIGQIEREKERKGEGSLEQLLKSGDVWTVHGDGSIS